MALTQIQSVADNTRTVKVRIIADTVLSQNGRGVPIYTGSVLEVTPWDANTLINSFKAEKAKPEDEVKVFTTNQSAEKGAPKKVSLS
jgi:hypothetical protein